MSDPAMKKSGGPAFPLVFRMEGEGDKLFTGMSLRDWFAGQALASMTAAPDYSKGPCNAEMAHRAFIIADAMLRERAKETSL